MKQAELDQKYEAMIIELDLLIKSGKIKTVADHINELNISQVPRTARRGLAKCCRRIGLTAHGLRLLHPIVRSQNVLDEPVNAGELSEYSALLSRNGSVTEALNLLKGVDTSLAPEALLYKGQCHILNWEYAEAVEYFEKFLISTGDDYTKMIARVNLASGYIVLFRFDEAIKTLTETVELAKKAKAARLLANCYELLAQVCFWQNNFSQARVLLNQASEIFNNAQSLDQLLIDKTQSIMSALEENSVAPLIQFKRLAEERRNWESVREADLFMLKIAPDQKKVDHLIFGTPKAAYRQRIQKILETQPSETYILGTETGPQLDLQTGIVTATSRLAMGKKIHQVLSILNRDFYAPANMATLFYELYPDEYFDVDSSPFRIRQAILRARHWLKENEIPASIIQNQGTYRFSISGGFGIKFHIEQPAVNPMMTRWLLLKTKVPAGTQFRSEEICLQMGWSRTAFRRLADWALERGELQRSGTGKATSYQIVIDSKTQAIKKTA